MATAVLDVALARGGERCLRWSKPLGATVTEGTRASEVANRVHNGARRRSLVCHRGGRGQHPDNRNRRDPPLDARWRWHIVMSCSSVSISAWRDGTGARPCCSVGRTMDDSGFRVWSEGGGEVARHPDATARDDSWGIRSADHRGR